MSKEAREYLTTAIVIVNVACIHCARGVEPERALRTVIGIAEGELRLEIAMMARAIWAVGCDTTGKERVAAIDRFYRILACAETLCSFGVEPREVANLLRWVGGPDAFQSAARAAWASVVDTGAVAHVPWSFSMPVDCVDVGAPAVVDVLSQILDLADSVRAVVEPHNVINVLSLIAMPPRLAAMVRACWAPSETGNDPGSPVGG